MILWQENWVMWCSVGTKIEYTWTWERLMCMACGAEGLSRPKVREHSFGKGRGGRGCKGAGIEGRQGGERIWGIVFALGEISGNKQRSLRNIYKVWIMLGDEIPNPWNVKYNPLDSLLSHGVGFVWRTKQALKVASRWIKGIWASLRDPCLYRIFFYFNKITPYYHQSLRIHWGSCSQRMTLQFSRLWNSWLGPQCREW